MEKLIVQEVSSKTIDSETEYTHRKATAKEKSEKDTENPENNITLRI